MNQPFSLQLASKLESKYFGGLRTTNNLERQTAKELRRLHTVVEELEARINALESLIAASSADGDEHLLASRQPKAPQWPKNPQEIRDFVSGHFSSLRFGRDDAQPDSNDVYTMTAHDLLSAIDWWADFPHWNEQSTDTIERGELSEQEVNTLLSGIVACR